VHALHAVIMKVQLLVSEWCMPCRDAEQVWRRMAQQKAFAFEVLDVAQLEGRAVVAEHQRAVRSRERASEIEHADTVERAGCWSHHARRVPLWRWKSRFRSFR
jgi:hypothetical protein